MASRHRQRATSERRQRARRALDEGARQVERWLDDVSQLVEDGNNLASQVLRGTTAPGDVIADFTAFNVNAVSTLCCCVHPGPDGTSPSPHILPIDLNDPTTLDFVFDVKSETSGPITLIPPEPLTFQLVTPLIGTAGQIRRSRVLVRVTDPNIYVTLRDLRDVPVGTYQGTLTLLRADATPVVITVNATCKDEHLPWWL